MAYTIDKVLTDARSLVKKLRDHDSSADLLITQSQVLSNRIETMNEYQEDLNALNEIARHRPRSSLIMSLVQESSQIRELKQQNNELQMCLEDHQNALELIMSKYRQQIVDLMVSNKGNKKLAQMQAPYSKELLERENKIQEMVSVMQQAVNMDDKKAARDAEELARLRTENTTLRKLLQVSRWSGSTCEHIDETTQTDVVEPVYVTGASQHCDDRNNDENIATDDNKQHSTSTTAAPVLTTSCVDEYDDDRDSLMSASMSDSFDSQISISTLRRKKTVSESTDKDCENITDSLGDDTNLSSPDIKDGCETGDKSKSTVQGGTPEKSDEPDDGK